MITIEQLKSAIGPDAEDRHPFQNRTIDHDVTLINLLRERIPFDDEKNIIKGANHDVVYLIDIDTALKYLNEEDLLVLIECNTVFDEESDCLSLYV